MCAWNIACANVRAFMCVCACACACQLECYVGLFVVIAHVRTPRQTCVFIALFLDLPV